MHPLAGKPAPTDLLIDVARLERDYYARQPNLADPTQLVSFGTSGHRGTPFEATFTEAHILAITQAICEYRSGMGINGPLFLGKDTHAASYAAERTALEVLAANKVQVVVQRDDGYTPTPAISHAILTGAAERGTRNGTALPTASSSPSHNPPRTELSTTLPTAARRIPRSPPGFRPGERAFRRESCRLRVTQRGRRADHWREDVAGYTTRGRP
jgi:phosphoglucomutase